MDEIQLIDRTRAGDHEAFVELCSRLYSPTWRMAYTVTTDEAAANEAVLEACVTAYRQIGNLAPSADFGRWFYAIAVDCARRQHRRAPWKQWLRNRQNVTGAKRDLWQAVCRLPVDLRAVLALRYVLDMNGAEMATVLGLPPSTVKARLHRAHQSLLLRERAIRFAL